MTNRELEKKDLIDKVGKSCYMVTFENRDRKYSSTYGYVYLPKVESISIEGASENIFLWSIISHSSIFDKYKKMYFYTDTNGNLLFNDRFFDYATPFSDGCAFVQFEVWKDFDHLVKKSSILDVKRHQMLSVPIEFKDVDRIVDHNISVLDKESKKWGSYIINPDTGEWTCDIPFIWDALSFFDNGKQVYTGIMQTLSYYPNWDNTPYYRMVPEWDKVEYYDRYTLTSMPKECAYDFDTFKKYDRNGCSILVNDFKDYIQKKNAEIGSLDYSDIVNVGDIREYTYKKSYLKK